MCDLPNVVPVNGGGSSGLSLNRANIRTLVAWGRACSAYRRIERDNSAEERFFESFYGVHHPGTDHGPALVPIVKILP